MKGIHFNLFQLQNMVANIKCVSTEQLHDNSFDLLLIDI